MNDRYSGTFVAGKALRKVIAILILLLFSYRCVYQFSVVAWYELNKQQIAQTFCENKDKPQLKCNGKCYLRKQLKKVSDSDTPDKRENQKTLDWLAFVTPERITWQAPALFILKPSFKIYQRQYHFLLAADIFHPPPFA